MPLTAFDPSAPPNPILLAAAASLEPAPEPIVAPSPVPTAPLPSTLAVGAGGGRTFFRGQQFTRSFPRFARGARLQPTTLLGGGPRLVDPTFPRNDLLNMLLLLRFGDR